MLGKLVVDGTPVDSVPFDNPDVRNLVQEVSMKVKARTRSPVISLCQTLTHSHFYTLSLTLSDALSDTRKNSLSLTYAHSLQHSHSHLLPYSLSLILTNSLSLSLTYTD